MKNFTFRSWLEALGFANFQALNTGVRQRVRSVRVYPHRIWQVKPVDGLNIDGWADKIERALQARAGAKKIREGKPVSFRTGPGQLNKEK